MEYTHEYHNFTDIRFGIDKFGRIFFTGIYPNGRRQRISMRDALYNGKPTVDGVEFSPGFFLPYGEIDPVDVASTIYTGSRLERLLGSENPKRKVFVIYKNSYYQRTYYDDYPPPPYSRISEYGISVTWHVQGRVHEFQHDIRMRELGKQPNLEELFYRMMKMFSYEIHGNSDAVVYLDGVLGLFDPYAKGSNKITTSDERVIIDNMVYFKDQVIAAYPLRRESRSGSAKSRNK